MLQATLDAWYMDDAPEDQRLPHRKVPNEPASMEKLAGACLNFRKTSIWGFGVPVRSTAFCFTLLEILARPVLSWCLTGSRTHWQRP